MILAISDASPELLKNVSDQCEDAGVKLIVVPPVREMIGGRVTLGSLREFNVADLLGRRPIHTDLSQISDYVNGKVVLVTGAGGSIGSELARQVQMLGPAKLILLDRDESALHGVQLSLYGSGLLDTDDMVLCSIRDPEALQTVFENHRPEVVFHAAALKHLPMLQRFPVEGWKTNVLGTWNVLRCAHEVGVRNFVNISTDKAADASSVLGQTKRLAERLTAWYANRYELPYLSVRFGNVLGSRGSVVHTFKAQIEQGGPVTVTHPDVTRYFMTIPEACELVLQAGAIGRPGDVLVLDMGQPVKIIDVAERLIAESGRDDIKVKFTGLRPGEKLHEVLFSEVEQGSASQHPLISGVLVPDLDPGSLAANLHTTSQVRAALDWYCDEALRRCWCECRLPAGQAWRRRGVVRRRAGRAVTGVGAVSCGDQARLARPGALPAGTSGPEGAPVHHAEVPFDAGWCRGRRGLRIKPGRPGHPGWACPAAHQPRRVAAVGEHHPGRHVDHRPASHAHLPSVAVGRVHPRAAAPLRCAPRGDRLGPDQRTQEPGLA